MELPAVEHHDGYMHEYEAIEICQAYVKAASLPCTVIRIDEEVCYAFVQQDGEVSKVQCYKLISPNWLSVEASDG